MIRRQIAVDLASLSPRQHPRQHPARPNDYAVKLRARAVARGVLHNSSSPPASAPCPAARSTEPRSAPAYGDGVGAVERELLNYTVVEATAVLATHLTEVIKSHAHELLTRQEVKNLIDNLKQRVPALVEEVIPTQIKPGELQKVMQNLLRERVPVRDLETILETLGDFSSRTKDLEVLTEFARNALSRTICKQYVDDADRGCVTLDPPEA